MIVSPQTPLKLSIPWGNSYLQLILTGVIAGLIVTYVAYRLDWNGGDDPKSETDGGEDIDQEVDQNQEVGNQDVDQEVGGQDVDQEIGGQDVHQEAGAQDVDQSVDQNANQNVNVYVGEEGSESESTPSNSLDGCLNCYPRNLESGDIEPVSDTRNDIPTFQGEAEAAITIDWPSEQPPSWILVDGGTEVFVNFKDKPGNMTFDGKRFRVGEYSDIEHFDIEFSAPSISGTQEIRFQHIPTGDVIHQETLIGL